MITYQFFFSNVINFQFSKLSLMFGIWILNVYRFDIYELFRIYLIFDEKLYIKHDFVITISVFSK